uniref:Uncharacterized protein n=1 Tax=Magallana gigas TaxID=29159 RepID=K1RC41_MAGGI
MYLAVVIEQVGSVMEAVNVDGVDPFVINVKCSPGYYGYKCVNQCSEHCSIHTNCDRVTGRCTGGCTSGWAGDTCNGRHIYRDSVYCIATSDCLGLNLNKYGEIEGEDIPTLSNLRVFLPYDTECAVLPALYRINTNVRSYLLVLVVVAAEH